MDGNPNNISGAQGNPTSRHTNLEDRTGMEDREERDQFSVDESAFMFDFAQQPGNARTSSPNPVFIPPKILLYGTNSEGKKGIKFSQPRRLSTSEI